MKYEHKSKYIHVSVNIMSNIMFVVYVSNICDTCNKYIYVI